MSFGPWGPEREGRVIKPDFFRTSNSKKPSKPKMTRGRLTILIIVLVILFFILVVSPLASIYTDALWYNHIEFQSLFWKMLSSQVILVFAFGAIFFILLYGNIRLARKLPPAQKIAIEGSPLEGFIRGASKWWSRGLLIFSIVAAFVSGLGWGGRWETVLKFFNHSAFGKTDPIFHKDIGFYLFSFPFFRELIDWLISSLIFVFVVTVIVYLLDGGIKMKREPGMLAPNVKAHLSVLLGLIFIVKAISYRLNMYELLFTKDGVVWGAGYTDASARLPVLWILTILSILCAAIAITNIRYKGWKLPVIAVGVLVGVSIIGGTLYPLIIQTYRVKPNERKLESKYLRHNIDLTREAYKLDTIESSPYAAESNLDAKDIEANQATIRSIRLWGPEPMLTACEQLQAIRQYYVFNDVDVDRYDINGTYRQALISAREINSSNLPQPAQTWVNKRLVYTHGYGVCLAPSSDIGPEGNPNFIVEDIPPRSTTNIQVKKPEVYFGEATADPVIVKTTEKEFDYPRGEERIYTTYTGKGGVEVKS
ncbi:MAG: UPF0182 family protein, partial [Actinomycetota bacterium]|nr:UPF0182 family protein [Actinomycetota bacterium]